MDFELLKKMCAIHAPSGNEVEMKKFVLNYIAEHQQNWKVQPKVVHGEDFQDCVILVFGTPKTAVFAHMDSIGFAVRYDNKLVMIGGPETETGYVLVGKDSKGEIETKLIADAETGLLCCDFQREIERGTELVFKSEFMETDTSVQSCYLDNRLGVFAALQLAQNLENGVIVFSCYEEHGGGTVPFLVKYLWESYKIRQYLVCDITWITEGVQPGKGVAISIRDSRIPRRSFIEKVVEIAKKSEIPFQLEVEGSGGSDGREIQASPYPLDWIFIGAAEENVHSPYEKVHKNDISGMIKLYEVLMNTL